MRLGKISVRNYKAFRETPEIVFQSGFNIIVGQNDAGKSSLLEASSLKFEAHPHRSLITFPRPVVVRNPLSDVTASFFLSRQEVWEAFLKTSGLYIPVGRGTKGGVDSRAIAQSFLDQIRQYDNEFAVSNYRTGGYNEKAALNAFSTFNEHSEYYRRITREGNEMVVYDEDETERQRRWDEVLTKYIEQRIYHLKAERVKPGRANAGVSTVLQNDASNLPEVLMHLQTNPPRLKRLTEYMQLIFPHLEHVTVALRENGIGEILLWPRGIEDREDLAIRLSDSGTGVGQVLAILYVVLTAQEPQIFLLDEPQTFLHPGAARKLIEILRSHDQHQFIVSTHSPEIIAATEPRTVTILRKRESETYVEIVDFQDQQSQSQILTELGIRLSDVFGADSILWVEGKTEELCFPKILTHFGVRLGGVAILRVSSTGDLESKHAPLIYDLYKRLSRGAGLIPQAIGF
ncbi:MAG TPA: AAA family ATPase, partial [Longimicrobium sp.]|nr:AAA family ATPase [Longimicrobium sp.]